MLVKIDLSRLPAALTAIHGRVSNLLPVMQAGRIMAVSEVRQRFQTQKGPDGVPWMPLAMHRPGSSGGDRPLLDHGYLQASITGRETTTSITVGTSQPQAPLLHFGGTVTPKKGKFLAIPQTLAAKRSGGARRFGQPLRAIVNRLGTFGVLEDGQGTVQFLLVKKSVVPARPFIGFSLAWFQRFRMTLGEYLTTGRL